MTNRLFISLDIPEDTINQLINHRNEIYGLPNDLKWIGKDKLHITLKFLGDVGENLTELMIRQFDEIIFNKIKVEFSKFSFFGKINNAKILYAGLKKNIELTKIQNLVERKCMLLGFNNEKRTFNPHTTLLRLRGNEDIERLKIFIDKEISEFRFEISSFSLIKSVLESTGSEFTILKSFKLI